MKVLVAGASGQLAQSLVERGAHRNASIDAVGRPVLDIADPISVAAIVARSEPDIIINAAAYTAVDKAEEDRDAAFDANAKAPENLAMVANDNGIPFLHVSTDYVFSGDAEQAYVEEDKPNPQGVYGLSKLEGEQRVLNVAPRSAVFRTAWVYSPFGNNFLKTMLRLAETRDELGVVADQTGTPTSALDIADGLLAVSERLLSTNTDPKDTDLFGVFHMSGTGKAVWADFAEEIFTISKELGGPSARVNRITTKEFPTPARRPANSLLNCDRLERVYGVKLPNWEESVRLCVERVLKSI